MVQIAHSFAYPHGNSLDILPANLCHACTVGLLGAWTPGMGAHGWVVDKIAGHGSVNRSRGWLAGLQ